MHAVVVRVTISDFDSARQELQDRVVPAVSQAPGFVAGYWLAPEGNQGTSIVLFESEDAARGAAEQLRPPETVTISPSRRRSSSASVASVFRRSWSRTPESGCSET